MHTLLSVELDFATRQKNQLFKTLDFEINLNLIVPHSRFMIRSNNRRLTKNSSLVVLVQVIMYFYTRLDEERGSYAKMTSDSIREVSGETNYGTSVTAMEL